MNRDSTWELKETDRRRLLRALGGLAALSVAGGHASTTVTASPGDEEWVFETEAGVRSSPTIVGGTVFIGSIDSNLYAVDAETGDEQWVFETEYGIRSSPSATDDYVFIGNGDQENGNLYAVNSATGEQEWVFETDGEIFASPTVVDGTVFAKGLETPLYALDANTGDQQWTWGIEIGSGSSPTVVDGTVFVENRGTLFSVDIDTGDEQWRFDTGARFGNSATVADGTVFIGSEQLHALDAETGDEQWSFQPSTSLGTSPTVYGETVFVGGGSEDEGRLFAVDAETGDGQWLFEADDRISSSPTVVDGTVFVGSHDNNLYAVDAETGEEQWAFETSSWVLSSPTVVDGTIFFGGAGSLYAVDAGVEGSSEDSRVNLGTLGHHADWEYADESSTDESSTDESNTDESPTTPTAVSHLFTRWLREDAFLLSVVSGIGVVSGYTAWRSYRAFRSGRQSSTDESSLDTTGSKSTTTPETKRTADEPTDSSEPVDGDLSKSVTQIRERATEAIERAETADANGNLNKAVDHYEEALRYFERVNNVPEESSSDEHQKIVNRLEATQTKLDELRVLHKQRQSLRETLELAEQSFQEAVIAYTRGDRTLSRIRFRQARDSFDEAQKVTAEHGEKLFDSPIEAAVDAQHTILSATLENHTRLNDTTLEKLQLMDIETATDLTTETGSIIPTIVAELEESGTADPEEATLLTILSWWYDNDVYEFTKPETIDDRIEQATYGFEASQSRRG